MMKLLKLLFLPMMVLSIASGCSTTAASKVSNELTSPYITDADNQEQDDKNLQNTLQDALNSQLAIAKIKVVVRDYNVLLVGQVFTQADKSQAGNIVQQFPSTKKVFNYLTVSSVPKLNLSSSLSSDAKNRIIKQNDIDDTGVTIVTCDGVVYIMGSNVGNLSALNLAIKGVYAIEGVIKVVNLVQKGDHDYYANNYGT